MAGVLRVKGTFIIRGRGLVVSGEIVEGTIEIGGRAWLPIAFGNPRRERITGLEMGTVRSPEGNRKLEVGILVGEIPGSEIAEIRSYLTSGTLVTIEDPEPGYKQPIPKPPRPWWRFW
jgi:translation elongation factor EF-Tu-like GTPase